MKAKKLLITLGLASIVAIISACGSDSEAKQGEPIVIGAQVENPEQVTSFSHIHGLSKHPSDNNKLLLASHYGLIEYDKESTEAHFVGSERFDLMGYSVVSGTDILMTSGHPGEGSKLPNPLGFLWSEDFGQTWEVRGLHGMIDFHGLTATSDHSILLGYGSDAKSDAILKSTDQGFTWEVLKTKGLPLSHDEFFDLGVAPNNGEIAYAATSKGLFYSNNGGVDWVKKFDGYFTALTVLGEEEVVFYEASENGLYRLNGEEVITYDLYLGADAVNYIVVDVESSAVTVATFQNNLLETTDHGGTWETLLKEGNF
ncbi:exo-alpha-sialidase [Anaerobacillus sp. CMMVII]|uniref:F510_1955 family glycosylhydrolase n=1 Tax=Anaerobacillus sp. CMMVII TaxID=2755588 RepID=UPI0021B7F58F|nr:sialidase family protein [Anaerobacillus sp. CMMVII]MCT8137737.1 exo-alpha-sialidase [Anaerobacillus sp. CMMVII]